MSEAISNDYVSMISNTGSGYNIPVIVDAIVDAAIAPMKEIVTGKKEKADAMVSGMALLKATAKISQTNVNSLSGISHHTVSNKPNSNFMSSIITDASKITAGTHTISDLDIAKPMVFKIDGVGASSASVADQTITINFGANTTSNSFSSQTHTTSISFNSDTVASAVKLIDDVAGLNAEIVQTGTDSTVNSILITSDTGLTNGFTMVSSTYSSAATTAWDTRARSNYTITQAAENAVFKVNDVDFARESNTVSDVIPGLEVKLLADNTATVQSISVSKSRTNIQATVEALVAELNAYKKDLDSLGFVDTDGDEDGDLAQSSYLSGAKTKFRNFMASPILGYGDDSIFFVEFGVKTQKDGTYGFDKIAFDRTYRQAPEKFDAVTQDKAYASDPSVFVFATSTSKVPLGKHQFTDSDNNLAHAATGTQKTLFQTGSGPHSFGSTSYPGFLFQTDSANPGDLDIYVARSAKTKLFNFFGDALAVNGSHDVITNMYKTRSSDLDTKLDKIDQREALLQSRYTKQFGAMEKVVSSQKSSAEYITQLVDGWSNS